MKNDNDIRNRPGSVDIDIRELYNDIVEKAGIAIIIKDMHGNITYANDEFINMFGYDPEDKTKIKYPDLIHSDDRKRIIDAEEKSQSYTNHLMQYEFKAVKRDGTEFYVEVSCDYLLEKEKLIGKKCFIWDITERKFAEEQWQGARENLARRLRYEEGISGASAALLSYHDNSLQLALQYLMNAFGAEKSYFMENVSTPDEKLLMKLVEIIESDNRADILSFPYHHSYSYDEHLERWKQSMPKGDIIFGYLENLPDKERNFLGNSDIRNILLIPVFSHSKWYGFLGFNNIDSDPEFTLETSLFQTVAGLMGSYIERKSAEELLKKARDDAEELSRMKSQFLANVSHEIRTPMNGIIGFSEIILNSSSLEEIHNKAKAIISESESLLILINEILDHTKIEAGKTELEEKPVNLHKMLEEVADVFTIQAENKGIDFRLEIAPEVTPHIICDKLRLRQVIINLTSNAVKFTSEGFVQLKVQKADITDSEIDLVFSVVDTGIGIAKEKQENIFDSYSQADGTITRKYGGTGLGTTISKQLVELMGGNIGIESEPGEGSIFWFRIKFRLSDPVIYENGEVEVSPDLKEALREERKLRASNILVVDDYPPNREVANIHLKGEDHHVDNAENGLLGLEMCRYKIYDLILMDLQMPEMDGYTAVERIRSELPGYAEIPIVALTANADEETRQKCLNEGFNDLIAKPIRRKQFLDTVDKWLFLSGSAARDTEPVDNVIEDSEPEQLEFSKPPMDYDVALDEFGDQNLVEDVAKHFLENVEKQLPLMRQAIDDSDYETLRREAHSIKGGAATLEAVPVSEAAKKIEMMCKNKDFIDLEVAYEDLISEFNKLNDFIDRLFI